MNQVYYALLACYFISTVASYLFIDSPVAAVDDLLSSRQAMLAILKKKLLSTQTKMKHYADQHRRDVSYNLGDWVCVKLRPYRQSSVTGKPYNKLQKCYYGPYKIIECIGKVAYKLELPSTSKIHPVFHCSLLKPHLGPFTTTLYPLPPSAHDNQPLIEPLVLLDSKLDTSSDPARKLVLVQWTGLPPEDATWEHWDVLAATYYLEDKVLSNEGGNDSNMVNENAAANDDLVQGSVAVNRGRRVPKMPARFRE